jgi:DNA-binding GntR family transcriptional regulator
MEKINTPIRHTTIKEQVYETLKQGILSGAFQPGEWLQEAKIAKSLSVSRSPVREALQQLLGDGLAVNVPNKGVYVKKITTKDMQDIFEVRMCFETIGIQKSAQNLTDEIREELRGIRENLLEHYETGDKESYINEDARLHKVLIKLSGNQLIMDLSVRMYTMEHLSRTTSLYSEERFRQSVEEHIGVIDSILAGDIEKALAYNSRHLNLAREESLRQVDEP